MRITLVKRKVGKPEMLTRNWLMALALEYLLAGKSSKFVNSLYALIIILVYPIFPHSQSPGSK